jgi:hypothetical protein
MNNNNECHISLAMSSEISRSTKVRLAAHAEAERIRRASMGAPSRIFLGGPARGNTAFLEVGAPRSFPARGVELGWNFGERRALDMNFDAPDPFDDGSGVGVVPALPLDPAEIQDVLD